MKEILINLGHGAREAQVSQGQFLWPLHSLSGGLWRAEAFLVPGCVPPFPDPRALTGKHGGVLDLLADGPSQAHIESLRVCAHGDMWHLHRSEDWSLFSRTLAISGSVP